MLDATVTSVSFWRIGRSRNVIDAVRGSPPAVTRDGATPDPAADKRTGNVGAVKYMRRTGCDFARRIDNCALLQTDTQSAEAKDVELPEGRPRTTGDLAAAKLRTALVERSGYVVVTSE